MIMRSARSLARQLRSAFLSRGIGEWGGGVSLAPGARLEQRHRMAFGEGCQVEHGAVLRANTPAERGINLKARSAIKEYVLINASGGRVDVGADCWIGPHCVIYGNAGVSIGAGSLIAAHTTISSVGHEYSVTDVRIAEQALALAPVVIGEDVWIGLNCTVLPGVTIGRGSVVGAGAVVSRDLPPYSIAVGVPARIVGNRLPSESAGQALERTAS